MTSQNDRAAWYKGFASGCKADKRCVGWHWFRLPDQEDEGGANKGLVGIAWSPYLTLLDQCEASNKSWRNKVAS